MPVAHPSPMSAPQLIRRKGGGRGGGGGRGSSKSSKSSSKGSSSSKSSPKLTSAQTVRFGTGSGIDSKHSAKSYSNGGGNRVHLKSDSPFAGAEAGGGTRGQIYGNTRYGSGYPYGSTGYYYVDYRPFPFYFWPVPVQHNYYGATYYSHNENNRVGGPTVTTLVKSVSSETRETYHLIGDRMSSQAVMDSLTKSCGVSSANPDSFNINDTMRAVRPEQVVQWYRASSFALSLDSYNNSAALASNMPKDNNTAPPPPSSDTPLPSGLNTTFLSCLNRTIGDALPLVDYSHGHKLSSGEIAGIVIGSISAAISIAFIASYLIHKCVRRHHERSVDIVKEKKKARLHLPKFITRKDRGKYATVEEAQKQNVPKADEFNAYSSDEKGLSPYSGSSKKYMEGGSSSSLFTSTDSDGVSPTRPPFPFPEPKSTLDMQNGPPNYSPYPFPETKPDSESRGPDPTHLPMAIPEPRHS